MNGWVPVDCNSVMVADLGCGCGGCGGYEANGVSDIEKVGNTLVVVKDGKSTVIELSGDTTVSENKLAALVQANEALEKRVAALEDKIRNLIDVQNSAGVNLFDAFPTN